MWKFIATKRLVYCCKHDYLFSKFSREAIKEVGLLKGIMLLSSDPYILKISENSVALSFV